MEWRVDIAGPADLDSDLSLARLARLESSPKSRPAVEQAAELIATRFGQVRFTHAAFGNEFCEHLLPEIQPLRAARQAATERGLGFVFVTPYVSDAGLRALRERFAALDAMGPCEVVFSDWGVLRLLRREFPRLTPVQGRLLNKALRDPRVMGLYADTHAAEGATASTLVTLQRSNLDCASYTTLLSSHGVQSVEMDSLPQGMDLGFASDGVRVGVYLPFGFIATGRVCMAAGLHYRKPDKFQPGAACRHECQTHMVEFRYTNSPFQNRDQAFLLRGNTYFYAHTRPMIESLLDQASRGLVSRLIFQPRLPMQYS